ncbi:C10 family peptidase [Parabacteroides sp. AD58]|uniref:C10 family peptidase n=1 Tax=Parabacteroides absconsus TaxID=2951805 RepID=A0ABZ2IKD2_9BACT|nr:C10 family peptidase [Parabacteroides sp. AD58]MCM6900799.1 C10 family peptidase [Parabacteroides sp. AD58]
MKRRLLLLFVLFSMAFWSVAERIDVATARKIAENVAASNTGGLRSASSELSLIYAAAPGQEKNALRSTGAVDGAADYFVFNIGANKGFVIVSGDDLAYPVLGQSDEGTFEPDNLPENLRAMLAYYQNQISWAERNDVIPSADVQAEWGRYLAGSLRSSGEEVLYETAHWSQGDPYNRKTPIINGQHAVTGCVATAWAIAMKYNEWPVAANSETRVNTYWQQPVEYPQQYDWDNMLMEYNRGQYTDEQADAIATLMWNIGANVDMNYGVDGSGASSSSAAQKAVEVFGYSKKCRYLSKSDYRWSEWKSILRNELDEKRIVLYSGSNSDGGHAFVCDGYKDGEAFHINWGWGNSHGYYLLTALDPDGLDDPYGNKNGMTIGIAKPEEGETEVCELKYRSLSTLPNPTVGTVFNVYPQIYNIGNVSFSGWVNMAIIQQNGIIGTHISTKKQLSALEQRYYIDYTFECQLNSSLSEGERIMPIYSTDGSNWQIMYGTADAPLYIDMTGTVNEIDEPDDPAEKPVSINIYWNGFDDVYLPVSSGGYTYTSTYGISYGIINAAGDVVLRYTLKDYDAWKDALTLSSSNSANGTYNPVTIATDGSFEIPLAQTEFQKGNYQNFLEVSSTKGGKLGYKIQVYYASDTDRENPLFGQDGNEMTFVNPISGSITPNPITGQAGVEIPFSFTFEDVDAELRGKKLSFLVSLQCYMKEGVKLYYVETDKKTEIELDGSGTYLNSTDLTTAGSLEAGKAYSFSLLIPSVPSGSGTPFIALSVYADGKPVPSQNYTGHADISITSQAETYYQITTNFTHIQLQNGITQVKKGENLSLTLVPDAGYALPSTITVKVGGTVLGEYTYNSSNGYLYIASGKITGDIEITANGVEVKNTYTVTSQFTGLSVNGWQETVTEGDDLTFTLSANEGYVRPETITVKMGGTTLTAGNGYTYNQETGEVSINKVTGAVEVIAEAVKIHTVTPQFTGVSATEGVPQTVLNNKGLAFILQASAGYKLPETITVTMGGNSLVAGRDYTYEQSTGDFSITKVTGNVVVTVEADRYYTVSNTITNLTVTPEIPTEIKAGGTITFTLQAETGYKLPKTITVTMGDSPLTVENGYTYDVSTGEVSITPVQGNIQITATGEAIAYYQIDVTTRIQNLEVKGVVPTQVEEGENVFFTLEPDEDYKLPTAITVTMGDKPADFTYDAESGQVSIKNIQGKIVVIAAGIDNSHQEVIIPPVEGLDIDPIEPVETNSKVELTLKVQTGYALPETIEVTMGGKPLAADTDYTYDARTGKFTLNSITGELKINVVPVKIQYDVTATLTHLTATIAEKVDYNDPLSFTLVPGQGYKLPAAITVEMGASALQVGVDYTYNTTTGEVKINAVTDAVKITATGVELLKYTITMALTNLKSDKEELTVYEGESFAFKLIPDAGYRLPETITVTGANGTITGVVYNATSGEVKIPNVKEALTVTAAAEKIPTYAVEFQLTDVTTDWKEDAVVQEGGTLSCTLKANTGFLLPTSITVTMGGVAYQDYTYDASTGKVEVRNVKGKVVIVAVGRDDSMRKVKLSLSNVSSKPSPAEVPVNSQLELVFTADNGYKLPATIKVSMGNKTLTAGSDYTYNQSTGKFTLAKVTDNVDITVIAELIQTPTPDPDPEPDPDPKPVTYTVTLPVVEGAVLTSETGTTIKENENFIFTITLKDGYKNSKPVVKANGKEILPDSKGRYVVENVKTNITITVSGIVKDDPTANMVIQGSLKVWGADGYLHILSSKVGEAHVITYSGQLYKIITLTGGETITSLPSGIYIVHIDGQSYKVHLY